VGWTLRTVASLLVCAGCRFGFEGRTGQLDAAPSVGDSTTDSQRDGSSDALPALCPAAYANFAGHKYLHNTTNTDWPTAQAMCLADQVANSSLYTHLAVVGDAAELGVIQNFTTTGNVWIGFSDRALEGTFVWVTAEATAGYPPATGAPWASTEPTGGAGEDCAFESPTGTLSDALCTATYDFVCECDTSQDDPSRY
jgi:hypothetical protein